MDREKIAKEIASIKGELHELGVKFNRAYMNKELQDGETKVWNAVVKASDALCDAQDFVDKHYYDV